MYFETDETVIKIRVHFCLLSIGIRFYVYFKSSPYPSVEQDSGIHIFQDDDNTGSLPNLSELLLSLAGCPEDYIGASGHNNVSSLCPNTTQSSPDSRHQHTRMNPRPLFLPSSSVDHHQVFIADFIQLNDIYLLSCCSCYFTLTSRFSVY
jgi:hypothetical protein